VECGDGVGMVWCGGGVVSVWSVCVMWCGVVRCGECGGGVGMVWCGVVWCLCGVCVRDVVWCGVV